MKKVRLLLTLIFGLMGLLFLLTGGGIGTAMSINSEGMVPVEGVIVAMNDDMPLILYEVDGQTYYRQSNVSSSTFRVGNTYELMMDPADPSRTIDPGARVLTLVFCCVGGVMLLAAVIIHVLMKRRENRLDILRSCGLRQQGTVTRVHLNYSVRVNGRSPWVVEAQCMHPRTRETVTVKNSAVWETSLQPGDPVDVLFDPMDDGFYALDLEDK
ncbi:MAG: hypothetical protein IKK21_00600 [Clostridia bacterium]|nr:hypothetical protein [Clostridia bacterium]